MSTPSPSPSIMWLSVNKLRSETHTVGYHIIFVPLFTQTFLWDSLSYSQVLPYVTTIWSSSVDINSDSLLFISTLNFAFQGMGMHRTIFIIYHMFIPCLRNSLYLYFEYLFVLASFESRLSSSNLFPELSLSFVFTTHGSPILVLRNLGQLRWRAAQHIHWGQGPIIPQVLYLRPISILFRFQLQIFFIYHFPSWITA